MNGLDRIHMFIRTLIIPGHGHATFTTARSNRDGSEMIRLGVRQIVRLPVHRDKSSACGSLGDSEMIRTGDIH